MDLSHYFHCQIEDLDTHVILLSNGDYYENKTVSAEMRSDIIICSLKDAAKNHNEIFNKYYNKQAKKTDNCNVSINTDNANNGIFIYIPKHTKLQKSIQIINLTHGFEDKKIFPRHLFVIEENAELSLVVCNHTLNNCNTHSIGVAETFVGENANFKYYAIQNEHNNSIVNNFHFISAQKNASVNSLELQLHGNIIKNHIFVDLFGEHANANLFGLGLADKKQHFENHTVINHSVPNCNSFELYKNIVDDEARCNFEGKIVVSKDAQKTSAYQSNKNICLTETAIMQTKPQLEIYADDVKCSHGTTVGQLDENALFYLQQRGISEKQARQMLMFAFANDILNNIDIEALKNKIAKLIDLRLKGELSDKCNCLQGCAC